MKKATKKIPLLIVGLLFIGSVAMAQPGASGSISKTNDTAAIQVSQNYFIDEHDLSPGKVSFADVMAAHKKDLATQGKYGVNFIKFWIDEQNGKVFCLSTAKDSIAIIQTHREAHGMVPTAVYSITPGAESATIKGMDFFLDVHQLGAGNVTAAAVAEAHKKDLIVEKKYGVNFINYWVDVKDGTVFCLSEAPDSNAIIQTHKEAHGLVPSYVMIVKQGN